jgi:hypothetical protein|tara:strand:- start:36 stop:425 length:390 start_codon:yes stop_codon:yes gene_type:complete
MRGTSDSHNDDDCRQQQLSVSDRPTHGEKYPFIEEFSELIQELSTKEILALLTNQQRNLAKALWEAENYGGDIEKCKKRLVETHGRDWMKTIKFKEHFAPIRSYYELVLILEHQRQWDEYRKTAKICQD